MNTLKVNISDKFFFASADERNNSRWLKTLTVSKVGRKYFYVKNENSGFETKCEVVDSKQLNSEGILVRVVADFGESVYGYIDEETYKHKQEIKKMKMNLLNLNFFNKLPEEIKEKMYFLLKEYMV